MSVTDPRNSGDVVALAGVEKYRPPKVLRVAIGGLVETAGGGTRPSKLDYFQIVHLDAKGKSFVRDQEAQTALEALAGAKPKYVPIRLLTNNEEEVIRAERAFFWGGRRVCSCGAFRWKDEAEAKADDLLWPPGGMTPEEAAERGLPWPLPGTNLGEEYRTGTATRKFAEKAGAAVAEQTFELPCNPMTCPYATGAHHLKSAKGSPYHGVKMCKPHVVVSFSLPFVGGGAGAYCTTTGWRSSGSLFTTLRQIKAQTNGWLILMPLKLCLAWEQATVDEKTQKIPVLYFDTEVQADALPAKANEVLRELRMGQANVLALQAGTEPEAHSYALSREFHHETANEPDLVQPSQGAEALEEAADANRPEKLEIIDAEATVEDLPPEAEEYLTDADRAEIKAKRLAVRVGTRALATFIEAEFGVTDPEKIPARHYAEIMAWLDPSEEEEPAEQVPVFDDEDEGIGGDN